MYYLKRRYKEFEVIIIVCHILAMSIQHWEYKKKQQISVYPAHMNIRMLEMARIVMIVSSSVSVLVFKSYFQR